MDYKARLTLDTSQHDDAIKKSAKQVNDYDTKVKQTGTDVRKLIAEERKAARERAIANKRYQDMARSVGDFSRGLTGGISLLGKFSGALAIGATAAKVVSDAFMSTETNIDAWGVTMERAKGAYDVFVSTLNNGNWSNFFSNLKAAISGATDLYNVLDDLGSLKANNKWAISVQRSIVAELTRQKENGEDWTPEKEQQLESASKRLADMLTKSAEKGLEAASSGISYTIKKYDNRITEEDIKFIENGLKGLNEAEEGVLEDANDFMTRLKKEYERIKSTPNYTKYIEDENGGEIPIPTFNEHQLDEETQRIYRIGRVLAEKEGEFQKYIEMASSAEDERTSTTRELAKNQRKQNSGTTSATTSTNKLVTQEEKLKDAMEHFQKSIKSAQMKMSALKVWSGITNMSETEVLEESIRINNDEINKYRAHLEQLKEIQGETATLSEEENKQLKQLIETQKGYRRKLSKLKVEEEERRTNNDYSGLRKSPLLNINEIITKSWDEYINNLKGSELFDVWDKKGKIEIDNRFGRTDSELIEDYYNNIYEYLKNIEESRKEVQRNLGKLNVSTFVVNDKDFIGKFQQIRESVLDFFKEYTEKNGMQVNADKLTYDYLAKFMTDEFGDIEKAIYRALIKIFKDSGGKVLKETPDSELLYNMINTMLGEAVLKDFGKTGKIDIQSIDKTFEETVKKLEDELDGDKVAQDFVSDLKTGIQNSDIAKFVESLLKNRFGEALKKSVSEQLKEIDWKKYDLTKEQVSVWQNGSNAIRSFAGAWESMQDTLNDEDASGLDKFFAIQDVINSTIDSVFSLIDGYKQLQEIQKSFSTIAKQENAIKAEQNALTKESTTLKATETTTNNIEAASAGKAAIAEGTKKAVSTSSHWIEAIAAISAVVAAITAALAISGSFSQGGIVPKFADGGVISGNRTVGDYNIARVNSGELILNGTQQAKLFHLLDGTGGFNNNQPSGEVTFRIEGQQLVGVLNNFNRRKSKIV